MPHAYYDTGTPGVSNFVSLVVSRLGYVCVQGITIGRAAIDVQQTRRQLGNRTISKAVGNTYVEDLSPAP